MDWELGVSKTITCRKTRIYFIAERAYNQYSIINHNRKECVCVYITQSLCCTAEINTL